MTVAWFEELERRAGAIEGLSTTSSSKYDELKEWLRAELSVVPAVCFLSDLSKQWIARVGQALIGMPKLLVLLIRADSADDASVRLAPLHEYVSGLHATIVLVGDEGRWRVGSITGTAGRALYEGLISAQGGKSQAPQEDEATGDPVIRSRPSSGRRGDFLELEPLEQGEAVWDALLGKGPLELDEAIRAAANILRDDGRLGFERLRRDGPVYAAVEDAISWCARRGILFDRPRRGCVRAVLSSADSFSRDHWRNCVIEAISTTVDWMDRDELVRLTAQYAIDGYGLQMQRLRSGGRIDSGIRSAINGLIRMGQLERDGGQLLRRSTRSHVSVPPEAAPTVDSPSAEPIKALTPAQEGSPSPVALRGLVGDIPGEAEAVFVQLLGKPLKDPAELDHAVAKHLKEFEEAFEVHQFLDVTGAERLASDSRRLLELWPTLTDAEQRLAQAAMLYFVDSDEADDDFRIGGLRTDKLVMDAVNRFILRDRDSAAP